MYRYKRSYLNEEECQDLIRKTKMEVERMVIVGLMDTGLRLGEFIDLEPGFFNFRKKILEFSGRIIPLSPRCNTVFKFWFKDNKKTVRKVRAVHYIVKRVADRSKIITKNITPTTLRHTYVYNCIKNGVPFDEIQNRIGVSVRLMGVYAVRFYKGITYPKNSQKGHTGAVRGSNGAFGGKSGV